MKVLITGATGMLGTALRDHLGRDFELFYTSTGSKEIKSRNYFPLDLTVNDYSKEISKIEPDIIIHCAAITNVNTCETNKELADKVNADSVKKLLNASHDSTRLIYISSDAVFGDKRAPFCEDDDKSPISYYGKSKLDGESYLLDALDKHTIIRTTIVGQNPLNLDYGLVAWALGNVKESEIKGYSDSCFTPITSWQLAEEVKYVIITNLVGIWHISGSETCSKYDFIYKLIHEMDPGNQYRVKSGSLASVSNVGRRVLDQSLSVKKYLKKTKRNLPTINQVIESIKENYKE